MKTLDCNRGVPALPGIRSNRLFCRRLDASKKSSEKMLRMRASLHRLSAYETCNAKQNRKNQHAGLRQNVSGCVGVRSSLSRIQPARVRAVVRQGGGAPGRSNPRTQPEPSRVNTCPKCGHQWPDEKRAKGGEARWRGMSKSQRKQAASQAAKARWARRQNDRDQRRGHAAADARKTPTT